MKDYNVTICKPATKTMKGIFDKPNRFNGSNKRTVEQGLVLFRLLYTLTAQVKDAQINKYRSVLQDGLAKTDGSVLVRMPHFEELKFGYQMIERLVRKENPAQFIETHEQREFAEMIKRYTSRRFAESVLFGTFTLDAFTPIFSGRLKRGHISSLFANPYTKTAFSYRHSFLGAPNGFVFEVNGKCHDANQGRINKDSVKAKAIHGCNLFLIDISNQDVRKNFTATFLRNLEQLDLNCSKAREKIWHRIYLFTIACLGDDQMYQELFGLTLAQAKGLASIMMSVVKEQSQIEEIISKSQMRTSTSKF